MSRSDEEAHLHASIARLNEVQEYINSTQKMFHENLTLLLIRWPQLVSGARVVYTVDTFNAMTNKMLTHLHYVTALEGKIENIEGQLLRRLEYFTQPSTSNEEGQPIEELDREMDKIQRSHHYYIRSYYECLSILEGIYLSLIPRPLKTTLFPSHSGTNSAEDEKVECCCCIDAFVASMQVKQCPRCSKYFHIECMEKWFKTQKDKQQALYCPCCRLLLT